MNWYRISDNEIQAKKTISESVFIAKIKFDEKTELYYLYLNNALWDSFENLDYARIEAEKKLKENL